MGIGFREVLLLAALAGMTVGCAGDGPAGGDEATWFGQIQSGVFDQSCVAGACHNSATRAGGLSLAPGESYGELVGVLPDNPVARETGLLRVAAGSVDGSYLVAKLTGDLANGEGASMPPAGATPIPPDKIANIEAWIEAGASETAPPPDQPVDPSGASFTAVQREIFDASCVSSSCHNDATQAGGLTLSAGSSYDAIVGVAPVNPTARADGLLLVAPGLPDESFLLNKVTGELAPGDGSLMPLAATMLPDAKIQLLRDWIAAGAEP